MLRRIGVLASLAVVATMFAGISSAQAAVGDAGVCVFTGLAGNLVDSENGAAGIPSAQKDFQSDMDLADIERGTYNYGGPATCAGVFNGIPVVPALNNTNITSNGNYQNIVCGTGWAQDIGGANTVADGPGAADITNVGYEIPFLAGTGPLFIGTPFVSTAPDTLGTPLGGTYAGLGVVHIQPVSPDNCVTTDTNEFSVAGAFVGVGVS